MSCSQSRKVTTLPLVLISPLDIATGLSVGVAPVEDKNRKYFLGKAFEQAAINNKSRSLSPGLLGPKHRTGPSSWMDS